MLIIKKVKLIFWDNVYGINMDCFKQTNIAESLIDICPKDRIIVIVIKYLKLIC